ncbi:MAG: flagellin FliC [Bdellovibrionales bacterium]|nr:flagellin FliC [Bdellovibrionales bacterium]
MGMRINTNTQSLAAQRNLGVNTHAQNKSLEKLASGSRIVRSSDDAAGLAISDKMRADIRSIRQDARNAQDAVSMIQVAEGGMNETANILIRFRELSIQAASDTVTDRERGFIDKEVQQLSQEVDRIAKSTTFNGRKLLSGEGELMEIQIGQNNDPELDLFNYDTSSVNATAERLGVAGISVATKEQAQSNLDAIDLAIGTLAENRAHVGAMQNRLEATINNLNIYDENLSAANSRIRDADFALETSELTKNNVLRSSSTAVLSQANQNTQLALQLLS